MSDDNLKELLDLLVSLPKENEYVEFKMGNTDPQEIGMRLSALSNSACLCGKSYGYLIYRVEDETHHIKGTSFKAKSAKKGNEDLEMWLLNRLNPRIDIMVREFDYAPGIHISFYRIPAANDRPVNFLNTAYVRVNSCTRKLMDYPEKEASIWRNIPKRKFETSFAKREASSTDVISLLSTQAYFEQIGMPVPTTEQGIFEKFENEGFISRNGAKWDITNLGAILLAKRLSDFDNLRRKAIRIITYKDKSRVDTIRDEYFDSGYALAIEDSIKWIRSQVPSQEIIGPARRDVSVAYPEKSIRELFNNMIIHQDLEQEGSPTVEIFEDRIEFSNPGVPLIAIDRFIDEYKYRNDRLSDILRRLGYCEEKGSGMDKVIISNERFFLPPVVIRVQENRTIVILSSRKNWADTSRTERLQACYQHACIKYINHEAMTNQTLRERFNVSEKNSSNISRLIKDAITEGLIKEEDPGLVSKKYKKYIPYWA